MNTKVGTPWFVAPELLKGNYDEKIDHWSAGVTLFYMLFGRPPFYDPSLNKKVIYEKICQVDYSFPEDGDKNVSSTAKNLIRRMLVKDPWKRLSARDALNDMWFIPIQREYLMRGRKLISPDLIERLKNFKTATKFHKEIIKVMVNLYYSREKVKD